MNPQALISGNAFGIVVEEDVQRPIRWCQTDSNRSQFAAKCRNLCRTKQTPFSKSGGAVDREIVSAVEGAFLIEMIADRGMNGSEFL